MRQLLIRTFTDEGGQDLIEYALLGATVAFVGLLAINTLGNAINTVFSGWEAATQSLWYPQAPAA